MLGEFLYALTAKDAVSQPTMQRAARRLSTSASASSMSLTIETPPNDRVACITHFAIRALGGAAQTVVAMTLEIQDAVTAASLLEIKFAKGSTTIESVSDQCEVMLFPGERLVALVDFSAGAAANQIIGSAHMVYVPKANLQLR